MKTLKQLFFINTPKNALQKRETGYTESKGNSIRFGGTMFKKVLTFLAVVLIGLSVTGPAFAQSITGTTQQDSYNLTKAGYDYSRRNNCEENCSCSGYKADSLFATDMKEYTEENQGACWFCGIFKELFQAINETATHIFNKMGDAFLFLMGWGLLFLILFKVAKMVVQLQEVDVMQFLNDLIKPLGRGIIATALLFGVTSQSDNIFNMLTSPIFEVSARMGVEVLDTALPEVEYIKSGTDDDSDGNFVYTVNKCDNIDTQTSQNTVFTDGQRDLVICWLEQISSSFVVGIAIGGTLVDAGTEGTEIFTGGLGMAVVGLIIWGCFYLIYLFFPFKLIETFVRMAFVLMLMPLWIVLWVFPATVGYTKTAWSMFLTSCLMLFILSIMVSMAVILMSKSIPNPSRTELLKCLRADNTKNAATWVLLGSGAILNTIAFAAMAWTLIGSASAMSNSLIGGGGDLGIGNSMANLTARTAGMLWGATKTAGKVGRWAGGLALGGAAMAAGRRSGGSGGGGSTSSRGAALGRYSEGTSGSSGASNGADNNSSGGSNNESNNTQNNTADTTAQNDKPSATSTTATNNNNVNTTAQQTNNGSSSPDTRTQEAVNTRNNEIVGGRTEQDNKREQQDRAKDEINRSSTAEQTRQNKERSESQQGKVADIESQQREETRTKDRRQIQQEEAIHKLQQNQDGVRATQDLASNMAFIQEQMQSSATVDELRDKLKGHDWNYSGNSKSQYAHYMNRTAEAMFNAQRSGNTEQSLKEIGSAMYSDLKHGRITYLDDVINNVVQKSDNVSQIINNLSNLTKKG